MITKYKNGQQVYFLICGRYVTKATVVTASSWFVTIRFNKNAGESIIRLPLLYLSMGIMGIKNSRGQGYKALTAAWLFLNVSCYYDIRAITLLEQVITDISRSKYYFVIKTTHIRLIRFSRVMSALL